MKKKIELHELPKLKRLTDIRNYLLIIETMELQKLENAVCVTTKMKDQQKTMNSLKMVKKFYGQMTDFIAEQQKSQRQDVLEEAFIKEIANFTHFWEQTMIRFRSVAAEERKNLIINNKELVEEVSC